MFKDLDDAFVALRERTPEPLFEPAATVRRRGRRRTHRHIVLAGVAVVGVVAGAGALVAGPDAGGRVAPATSGSGSPATANRVPSSPVPSSSPPGRKGNGTPDQTVDLGPIRAQYPDTMFLQLSDLPGFTHRVDDASTSPTWPVILMCTGLAGDGYSSLSLAEPGREFNYAPEAPNAATMASGGPYASQTVRRYKEDGARTMFANIDAFHACRVGQGDGDRELARDFGGDQSRLWRLPPADAHDQRTRYLVYVRVGNLVTEADLYGVVDDGRARNLAATIADRLRAS